MFASGKQEWKMKTSILNLCARWLYPVPHLSEKRLEECFKGRWVVITGASRGIGFAMARRLMQAGANFYLIARSETELQTLCCEARAMGCQAECRAVDLRDKTSLDLLCHDLRKRLPTVDYLFCNAGKSICRKIVDATDRLHDFDRTMAINYHAMLPWL